MALTEQKLLQSYRMLHQIFPEDLHIARPFIQMLQHAELSDQASDLALSMARRMLACGNAAYAIGFLTLCKQLNHPDIESINAMSNMASLSIGNGEQRTNHIFTLIDQLSDSEGMSFICQGNLMQMDDGEEIVRQGESSKTFYLILNGEVDVQINLENHHSASVNTLRPGDFFGEFACVYNLRRSATVVASGSTLLLEFSDQAIEQLMRSSPIAGDYLMRTVQARMVHAMTHSLPAFSELPEEDRLWVAEESTVYEYNSNEIISDHQPVQPVCHILLCGSAELQLPDGNAVLLATGAMFGDISPYLHLPQQTTVNAIEHTLVCNMPENIFHSFVNAYASFDQHVKLVGASLNQKYQPARTA